MLAFAVALVAIAFGWDGIRIAPPPPKAFRDAALMQTGAQCIVDRCDPYSAEATMQEDVSRGALKVSVSPDELMYPPSTFLLFTPLAKASWPAAGLLFCWFGVLLVAITCVALVEQLELEKHPVVLFPLFAVLVSVPLGTVTGAAFNNNLHTGNATLAAAPLVALACLLLLGNKPTVSVSDTSALRDTFGWVLLGLTLALKPHLALGAFVALLAYARTRKSSIKAAALVTAILAFAVALLRLRLGSFAFLKNWAADSRLTFQPGHILDISLANPIGQDMLGLQRIAYFLGASKPWPDVFAWGAVACVIAAAVLIDVRTGALRKRVWCTVALCILISILAMYHAKYDRLLLLAILPAFAELDTRAGKIAVWLLSGIGTFWMLTEQVFRHVLGRAANWPVNQALPLILCVLLLWAVAQRTDRGDRLQNMQA